MAYVVSMIGVLFALGGVAGIIVPRSVVEVIGGWQGQSRFIVAVGIRLTMGVLFLLAASASRMPVVVQVIGVIAIARGVVLLLFGRTRMDRLLGWALRRPTILVRAAAALVAGLGILLVFAGA